MLIGPPADLALSSSYNQDAGHSQLSLDAAPSTNFLALIPPAPTYSDHAGSYYSSASHIYPGVDVRPRLGSRYV